MEGPPVGCISVWFQVRKRRLLVNNRRRGGSASLLEPIEEPWHLMDEKEARRHAKQCVPGVERRPI